MRPVVFVGPSCPLALARAELDADFRPPARRGDVIAACEGGARVIVLVDGYMIYDYPPSPSEVATAAASGAVVLGAASLGALRAVELRHRGVTGIGWVYQRYLDGTVDADDEVLVRMDPRTGVPASLPLVNLRYGLACLAEEGVVDERDAATVVSRLRRVHYEERTPQRVAGICDEQGLDPELGRRLVEERYDVKRKDTLAALRRAREMVGAGAST